MRDESITACPECFAAGKVVPFIYGPSGAQECVHNRLRMAVKEWLDSAKGPSPARFEAQENVLAFAHELYAQVFKG